MGLNTSSDHCNLRDNVSRKLGLSNGYFFGIIHRPSSPELFVSDKVGGAREDIERSQRFYVQGGVLRLNGFTAVARTWTNAGGLQVTFSSCVERKAAHDFVLASLKAEFPELLELNENLPNRMKFFHRSRTNRYPEEAIQEEACSM